MTRNDTAEEAADLMATLAQLGARMEDLLSRVTSRPTTSMPPDRPRVPPQVFPARRTNVRRDELEEQHRVRLDANTTTYVPPDPDPPPDIPAEAEAPDNPEQGGGYHVVDSGEFRTFDEAVKGLLPAGFANGEGVRHRGLKSTIYCYCTFGGSDYKSTVPADKKRGHKRDENSHCQCHTKVILTFNLATGSATLQQKGQCNHDDNFCSGVDNPGLLRRIAKVVEADPLIRLGDLLIDGLQPGSEVDGINSVPVEAHQALYVGRSAGATRCPIVPGCGRYLTLTPSENYPTMRDT